MRAAVRDVCKQRPIARVQLFGSLARGAADAQSDVDLLVEFMPGAEMGLLEMGGLREDLEERLACSVDVVSRRAVEQSRNPYRRRATLAAPVTIYAR